MSDLPMYEFEDIPWDDFCQSDDHIVPHPGGEKASEHSLLGDSRKKPRCEAVGIFDKIEDRSANRNVYWEKDHGRFPIVNNKRKNMLDKDSWPLTPEGVFHSSCESESINEVSSLASDCIRTSANCYGSNVMNPIGSDFSATAAILSDKNAVVDSNSYNYALDHISQTDDLNFFDSSRVAKDSCAYYYCYWPEIGNFEDVDRIFRSCDSTFGLGESNVEELRWFSPSDAVAGSSDLLKSEFKLSCPDLIRMQNNLEFCGQLRINDTSCSINETNIRDTSIGRKDGSGQLEHSKHDTLDFSNQSSSSNRKGDLMPVQQRVECESEPQNKILASNHSAKPDSGGMMTMQEKQLRQQNQSDGKRSDQHLSNGTSICYSNNSLQNEDSRLPPDLPSCQTVTSIGITPQKHATVHEAFSYLASNIQSRNSDYIHQSDQDSVYDPVLSPLKTGNNGFTSVSSKESFSSNQVTSAESSQGPLFQVTPFVPNEKRESLHQQQVFLSPFSGEPENMDTPVQVPLCDSVSTEKNAQHSGNKFEIHGDTEAVPGEVGSSILNESSSVSSVLDEISLEAASFRQLQLVMEQLDLQTKLCIRDSLYRLARSAEQRHNHENDSCTGDDKDTSGGQEIEGANRSSGFMDVETNTNPIDRSIAHLLFHRPQDSSSAVPSQDSPPPPPCKTIPAIHVVTTSSSPVMMAADGFSNNENNTRR